MFISCFDYIFLFVVCLFKYYIILLYKINKKIEDEIVLYMCMNDSIYIRLF